MNLRDPRIGSLSGRLGPRLPQRRQQEQCDQGQGRARDQGRRQAQVLHRLARPRKPDDRPAPACGRTDAQPPPQGLARDQFVGQRRVDQAPISRVPA